MSAAVVVGGGIAGLLSALLLRQRYESVSLIEKDAVCGGLMNSTPNADGVEFDYGTHLLSDTGLAALDELLYGDLDPQHWHTFQVIRTGNYFRGRMNRSSPFIDARSLGEAKFRAGFAELMATVPFDEADCPNLAAWLERHVGPTFTRAIHAPVLMKQLGAMLEELHPSTPFVLKRLVCADEEESRRLKQDPFIDGKVAFTSYEDGVKDARHRYPRSGGLGQWVRGFERRLADAGVSFRNGRTVMAVRHANGAATGVTLDDGSALPCDALVWTIPPFLLLKAAGLPIRPAVVKNRPIGLYHMVFDRPFTDQNYYVTCHDEALRSFRATLYPNVRGAPDKAPFNCTMEMIAEPGTDFPSFREQVLQEMRQMELIAPEAKLLSCEVQVVPVGFPATTQAFLAAAAEQSATAAAALGNALLLGRAKCPPFFTTDVLIEAHRAVTELCRGH